ncbi:MAG: DUF427 domain-containing protein, partial [Gammaproteobacteria bacterium]|nr:DUF427 domain-containing protein [Gammaproteobacteria bacterium]
LAKIPDYKVEIQESERQVSITCRGHLIADSTNSLLIVETRHDPVYYIPQQDVRMDLLSPTDLQTFCPFKGYASYWSLRVNTIEEDNLVWSYLDPHDEVIGLKGYLAFYGDRTELKVV